MQIHQTTKVTNRFHHFAVAVVVGIATSAVQAAVTYTDLYTLGTPAGFSSIAPSGIQIAASGQVVGYGSGGATSNYPHALLWSGLSGNPVDLNPVGFSNSIASGTSGAQQVGSGYFTSTKLQHALLWSGSAASAVDLNPTGFGDSYAVATTGSQQVGYGSSTNNHDHAILWSGLASSAIDLNPTGFDESYAYGAGGGQQAGYGGNEIEGTGLYDGTYTLIYHAILWSGSAASAIDLNPSGFTDSAAYGTSGTQQVGYGYGTLTGGRDNALLWNGSTSSAVDINPSGFYESSAVGTNGTQEVGEGYATEADADEATPHALLWSGTAGSYIDLQSVLPTTFTSSQAYSISGNTVYGTAEDTSGNYHAIVWNVGSAVPEPASLSIIFCGGLSMLRRRRCGSGR